MEEYFLKKCVPSERFQDAMTASGGSINNSNDQSVATRDTVLHPCEVVLIQENQAAHGVSRALLTKSIALLLQSSKTEKVVVFTLESAVWSSDLLAKHGNKLVLVDFSADLALWQRCLQPHNQNEEEEEEEENLLAIILGRMQQLCSECKQPTNANASKAPLVVVLDALHVLFQLFPVATVRCFLLQLRKLPLVGSIVSRLHLRGVSRPAAVSMASLATAVLQVETKTSLDSYPILSNERKRSLPKEADGLILLCRAKKNGASKQHVEYFQFSTKGLRIFTSKHIAAAQAASTTTSTATSTSNAAPTGASIASSAAALSPATRSSAPPLPVDPKRVTFNLSLSEDEQKAKSQVQLPFQYVATQQQQQQQQQQPPKQLFFIDPDDPDWDDDDLDDDLDI